MEELFSVGTVFDLSDFALTTSKLDFVTYSEISHFLNVDLLSICIYLPLVNADLLNVVAGDDLRVITGCNHISEQIDIRQMMIL